MLDTFDHVGRTAELNRSMDHANRASADELRMDPRMNHVLYCTVVTRILLPPVTGLANMNTRSTTIRYVDHVNRVLGFPPGYDRSTNRGYAKYELVPAETWRA